MRMIKKSIVVATALFFSMTMIQTNVDAASKKLKVNTVYDTTTKIKGKTKKKYLVKVKIGEKIYKKKASKKGNFTITIPKQKAGKKLTVKAYRKKNKKWKLYTTKTIKVKNKKNNVKKYPGKEDAIDLDQVKKDLATGKEISKGETALGKGHYYYLINYTGCLGTAEVGYVKDFISVDTDGETVTLKPLNGATLYYTAAGDGEKSLKDLEDPSDASQSLKSGQKATFKCDEYDAGKYDNFNLKVKAYKNGKLIAISYMWHYMIQLIALH